MIKPSKSEKELCFRIVKDISKESDDAKIEKIVKEVFRVAYSIGGDYGESTLEEIAKQLTFKA